VSRYHLKMEWYMYCLWSRWVNIRDNCKKQPQLWKCYQPFNKKPSLLMHFWWVFVNISPIVVVFCNISHEWMMGISVYWSEIKLLQGVCGWSDVRQWNGIYLKHQLRICLQWNKCHQQAQIYDTFKRWPTQLLHQLLKGGTWRWFCKNYYGDEK
jgi:hypothetical protein